MNSQRPVSPHRSQPEWAWTGFDGSRIALGNGTTAATLTLGDDQGGIARVGDRELAGTICALRDGPVIVGVLVNGHHGAAATNWLCGSLCGRTEHGHTETEREDELLHVKLECCVP